MKERKKRRGVCFAAAAVPIMAAVSLISVRMIDGTVQIDGDAAVLLLFLIAENLALGLIARRIYRSLSASGRRGPGSERSFRE